MTILDDFNYQQIEQTLSRYFGQVYDEFTITGSTLDEIENSTVNNYEVERNEDILFIFSDNVVALLEEDDEEHIIEGSVRKSLKNRFIDDKSTYKDRKILDLHKRF